MYAKPSATQYATVGLETGVVAASPHKLVEMLFDGAEAALRRALKFQADGNAEARSHAISQATNIVVEGLRGALDLEHGGEIAARLDALYDYMTGRLIAANVSQQCAPLEEVLGLLGELHAGWSGIGHTSAERPAARFNLAA